MPQATPLPTEPHMTQKQCNLYHSKQIKIFLALCSIITILIVCFFTLEHNRDSKTEDRIDALDKSSSIHEVQIENINKNIEQIQIDVSRIQVKVSDIGVSVARIESQLDTVIRNRSLYSKQSNVSNDN